MGISTHIFLPDDVRVRDVRTAIAFLAGAEKEKRFLDAGSRPNFWSAHLKDENFVRFVPTTEPSYVQLVFDGKQIDGETHMGHYFFENERGGRLVSTGSNTFWHAIGVRLVQLFGGHIDFNDCDSGDYDYACPKPRETNSPDDGQPWQDLEQALFDLAPITKKDLKVDWKKWASEINIKSALAVQGTEQNQDGAEDGEAL
jgi:hypothetical protein